jgi:putative iron-regulated protein
MLAWIALPTVVLTVAATATAADDAVRTYAHGVHRSYETARDDAVALQDAIRSLTAAPDRARLDAARTAWLAARDSYGRTEAFRFYEGPIDFVDFTTGRSGPELRLNAWPVDETFIAGLIRDPDFRITPESLAARNVVDDDAHVSTGYHAIEFLLWGKDSDPTGPGARPASDFAGDGTIERRRCDFLRVATELVVDDLSFLVNEWAPDRDNYAARFSELDEGAALHRALTGLIQLAGFELAMERLAIPLDSGDQEDEHSCFSDNTYADFTANAQGIRNVWNGTYGEYEGTGIAQVAERLDPELAELIEEQLAVIEHSVAGLPHPFDRLLASPADSAERADAEQLVQSLRLFADLLSVLRHETGKVDG